MGRWLASLRSEEKNTKTAPDRTDKTDKTSADMVLSVLSVASSGISEKFFLPDEKAQEGFVSFVSSPSDAFAKIFPTGEASLKHPPEPDGIDNTLRKSLARY
jgi:hypothetical protein